MAGTMDFKCPSCGAYLEFDPGKNAFVCGYCGSEFTEAQLQEYSERRQETAEKEKRGGRLKEYHCANCGAEIVTGETTAATRCYFCHNPVVITDRVSAEYAPDGVIPFALTEEEAKELFRNYVKKHWFVDRRFFSEAQMENFSGVYYPYWIGDIAGEGTFDGEGKTVSTVTTGRWLVTTTKYYRLERRGQLIFRNMIRKALTQADRQLSDGIHPYELSEMKKFAAGYLSGFLAEKRDVERSEASDDMMQEVRGYIREMMTRESGMSGVTGTETFTPTETRERYVLLPAWVLTYTHQASGRVFYYMMNGQNGKVCGKLPIHWGKLLAAAFGAGAAVAGLLCAGGALLW